MSHMRGQQHGPLSFVCLWCNCRTYNLLMYRMLGNIVALPIPIFAKREKQEIKTLAGSCSGE